MLQKWNYLTRSSSFGKACRCCYYSTSERILTDPSEELSVHTLLSGTVTSSSFKERRRKGNSLWQFLGTQKEEEREIILPEHLKPSLVRGFEFQYLNTELWAGWRLLKTSCSLCSANMPLVDTDFIFLIRQDLHLYFWSHTWNSLLQTVPTIILRCKVIASTMTMRTCMSIYMNTLITIASPCKCLTTAFSSDCPAEPETIFPCNASLWPLFSSFWGFGHMPSGFCNTSCPQSNPCLQILLDSPGAVLWRL